MKPRNKDDENLSDMFLKSKKNKKWADEKPLNPR